ncbi:MAG: hypothetical protein ACI3Y2_03215 [Candidatus Egerieousia sp.]
MGNLRTIKKDVKYLISEVVDDCVIYLELNGEEKQEKVFDIIGDALDLQDELFDKINCPVKDIKPAVYFKGIIEELLKGVDGFYERLSELSKQ